jgi:alpha-glucosidase
MHSNQGSGGSRNGCQGFLKRQLLFMLSVFLAQPSYAAVDSKHEPLTNNLVVNATSKKKDPWWQHAVFYEIYPRSFKDSNNDGIGDLNGITSKLDYLKKLGIDAIWLTPCYPSPQVDFGYDISDYTAIAKEYGTMEDFDRLVAEAKKRGIRIVMDLVMNHTSDQNKWFLESKSSRENPKRNWYIWRDGKDGGPPNNWQSIFGHSAWTLDPQTNQYFYHFFYPQQPDLNYRNPEVRKAMYDVARFWLNKGVAGFRLDAVGVLFEDEKLTDNPVKEGTNSFGDQIQMYKYNDKLPEVHDVLRELRQTLNQYPGDRVLIGETSDKNIELLSKMYGKNDELHLPMNFNFLEIDKLSAPDFRKDIAEWDNNPAKGWPTYFMSNHDQKRQFTRFADGYNNDKIAKLVATFLLTVRGTPILYYGEELGMENYEPMKIEDVQDPIGKIGWPKEKGRDGERTPMQWTDAVNSGFSEHHTWLPVALNYPTHNIFNEEKDKNSILLFYRKLIDLRRHSSALTDGNYTPVNEQDANVLAFIRKSKSDKVLVLMNMSKTASTTSVDKQQYKIKSSGGKILLSNLPHDKVSVNLKSISLKPYEAMIVQLH